MPAKRPTTIAAYIRAAPREAQPHLRQLYTILRNAAPDAEEAIKWGNPFFVEPRFLFAFSAYKAHLSFVPTASALKAHRKALEQYSTTKGSLRLPYDEPLPKALIRQLAEHSVREVHDRDDDGFW